VKVNNHRYSRVFAGQQSPKNIIFEHREDKSELEMHGYLDKNAEFAEPESGRTIDRWQQVGRNVSRVLPNLSKTSSLETP
jgi:hypothetical protein